MKRLIIYLCPVILCILIITTLIFQQGNSTHEVGTISSHSEIRVAAVLMSESNPFWKDVWSGVRRAADELGIQLSEYHYKEENQIEDLFETAVLSRVDGILLRSSDYLSKKLTDKLHEARLAGIRIIMVDTDGGEALRDMFIGVDNHKAGRLLADEISKIKTNNKRLLLIKSPSKALTILDRRTAFEKQLKILGIENSLVTLKIPDKDEQRIQIIQDFFRSREDIEFVVCTGAKTTLQTARTIEHMDLSQKIKVIGFCETEEAMDYVEKGTIRLLLVQDNFKMGYLGLEYLQSLLNGTEQDENIYYIDTTVVNKDNLQNFREVMLKRDSR